MRVGGAAECLVISPPGLPQPILIFSLYPLDAAGQPQQVLGPQARVHVL